MLLLSVNSVASYNSNVLRINQSELGDELLGLGPRFAIIEQQGPANLSLAKSTEKTTFQLGGGRAVTDGGGLLTTVTSTYATLGVNRRLMRRWSASWNATGSENKTLDYGLGTGKINSLTASAGLDHPLTEQLDARLSYAYTRQYSTGVVPYPSDFDNNVVSLTISYQLKKIALGH